MDVQAGIEFVIAEAGIRQLHARYVDAVWRKDYDAFGNCFAEDAEWGVAGMKMRGRAEIVTALKGFMENFDRVLMTFRTPILEVGKGVATGRTYVTESNAFKDGRSRASIGIYYERFVDQGDQWRFAWRNFELQYLGAADIAGPFFDQPDYGPPPAMPPLDAVPPNYSGLGRDKESSNFPSPRT